MRNDVTVKFVDFWPGFDGENNPFTAALRSCRTVTVLPEESPDTPDILFCSRCGKDSHYRYDCLKIYFTGENDFPDFNEFDYAISFYPDSCGGRNLRYPLYMFYNPGAAADPPRLTDREALERDFCSVVLSNVRHSNPRRLAVIDAVESYRPIAYGGAYRNNTGGRVADKMEFIRAYKFNLALENSDLPGYITEKILEPFCSATVPIFWGNEAVKTDFNPEAYINVGDYDSIPSFLNALRRIDNSPEEYLSMLRARCGIDRSAPRFDEALAAFLNRIADNPRRIVEPYGEIARRYRRNSVLVPLSNNVHFMRASRFIASPAKTVRQAMAKFGIIKPDSKHNKI